MFSLIATFDITKGYLYLKNVVSEKLTQDIKTLRLVLGHNRDSKQHNS